MSNYIRENLIRDGVDRRGFLQCMAWVGTGVVWAMSGGVLTSCTVGPGGAENPSALKHADFTFAQISDSHLGFAKDPNKDVAATLQEAIRRVGALPGDPAFILHTGDLTHLAKAEEFDGVDQIVRTGRVKEIFYVPGEHDVFTDEGKLYRQRYGRSTRGDGWYSFDYKGAHFVGLVNVMDLKPGGLGIMGNDQLDWLQKDLAPLSSSTPIVVFAHVPLWTVYEPWAGAPPTPAGHWRCCAASVPSPCSMAIFTKCFRRPKATSRFTRPAPPLSPSPRPAPPKAPAP